MTHVTGSTRYVCFMTHMSGHTSPAYSTTPLTARNPKKTVTHRSATHCNAPHCNTLQHTATHCDTLQQTSTHFKTQQQHTIWGQLFECHHIGHSHLLQRSAPHCNTTLQHINTLQQRTISHSTANSMEIPILTTVTDTTTHSNTMQDTATYMTILATATCTTPLTAIRASEVCQTCQKRPMYMQKRPTKQATNMKTIPTTKDFLPFASRV